MEIHPVFCLFLQETDKSAVGFTPFASTQSELEDEPAEVTSCNRESRVLQKYTHTTVVFISKLLLFSDTHKEDERTV